MAKRLARAQASNHTVDVNCDDLKEFNRMSQQRFEATTTTIELQKLEQERLQRAEFDRIMSMDTSRLPAVQKAYWDKRITEVAKVYGIDLD